jgi:hypothetical protein
MKHVIDAGTDAASLLLFDPGSLPEDFDTATHPDPVGLLERIQGEGRAYWIDTHADGAYVLHAYVDEPIPESLAPHTRNPVVVEAFQVPTGRLYFTGSEYAGTGVDAGLSRYPHMGGHLETRPGVYRLTIYEAEYPADLDEDVLRQEVTPGAFRVHQTMGCFVWLAILCAVGFAIALFGDLLKRWRYYLLPIFAAGVAWPFVLARLPPYRETHERYRAIQREHPAYVARLEWRGERS